jgi:hypothetical protein
MTDRPHLTPFLSISSSLTGFEVSTLLGTGMAERYHDLLLDQLGSDGFAALLSAPPTSPPAADPAETDAMTPHQKLIRLWYTGIWENIMVDPAAYPVGLIWRAIGANPPGARAPGYGTWALKPTLP